MAEKHVGRCSPSSRASRHFARRHPCCHTRRPDRRRPGRNPHFRNSTPAHYPAYCASGLGLAGGRGIGLRRLTVLAVSSSRRHRNDDEAVIRASEPRGSGSHARFLAGGGLDKLSAPTLARENVGKPSPAQGNRHRTTGQAVITEDTNAIQTNSVSIGTPSAKR